MAPPRQRRFQSQTERDEQGFAARQEREAAAPEPIEDDITSQYSGEALRLMRSRRPTQERIARLEDKHDDLASVVADIRENGAEMKGTLNALLKVTTEANEARNAREERESKERSEKRQGLPVLIKAIGWSIAAVVAAAVGYGLGH